MNVEDAKTVMNIAMSADNGCFMCTRQLAGYLSMAFPDHRELFVKVWEEETEMKFDETSVI